MGWSWKPDAQTYWAQRRFKALTRKLKRRQGKGERKVDPLLYEPSEFFYESKRWKVMRRRVLVKYGRRCMKCNVSKGEIHVDHIIPRSKAPHLSLTFSNLQVLCRDCNMEKSNKNTTDYREEVLYL
jgi:5-methylcytosine-specific restriction endonuclease McrA